MDQKDARKETVEPQCSSELPASTLQIVEIPVEGLELHPTLKRIPEMSAAEYAAFAKDVGKKGVTDPITCQKEGKVLDGRHRLKAQKKSDRTTIPARIVDLSEEEQVDYIYRSSTLRRHLSDDQRAVLAADWQKLLSKQAKTERAKKGGMAGGRGRGKDADSLQDGVDRKLSTAKSAKGKTSRKAAADDFNVPERKVKLANELMKGDHKLATRVLKGDLSLQQGYREWKKATSEATGQSGGKGKETDQKRLLPLVRRLAQFLEHEVVRCKQYWAGGDRALPMLSLSPEEVTDDLLKQLADVMKKQRQLAQQAAKEAERLAAEYQDLKAIKDEAAEEADDSGEDDEGEDEKSKVKAKKAKSPKIKPSRPLTVKPLDRDEEE